MEQIETPSGHGHFNFASKKRCSLPQQHGHSQSTARYFAFIDGLRCIAVSAVVANHLYPQVLPSGYLGVDIFFVISGFVITQSLLGRETTSVGSYLFEFYTRRVKRLAPALIVCVAATSLLIALFNPEPWRHVKTGLFSLIGVSNLSLYFDELDYWGQSARFNPFTHTWSLGVEEQFYFLFPAVLWLTIFRRAPKHFALATLSIASASVISLSCFLYFYDSDRTAVHYLPQFRVWQLGLGALVALYVASYNGARVVGLAAMPSVLFLGIVTVCLFAPDYLALWATVAATFATTFLILKGVTDSGVAPILEHTAIRYVGRVSYSLYLWHWPVVVISLWTIGIHSWSLPLQLLLIFALGASSYHFIERPLRHTPWTFKILSWRAGFATAAVVAMMLMVAVDVTMSKRLYLGRSNHDISSQALTQVNPAYCHRNPGDEGHSDGGNARAIQTIGNSHAHHILPVLRQIAKDCNLRLLRTAKSDRVLYPWGMGVDPKKSEAALTDLRKDDILIVSSRFRLLYQQPYLNGRGDKWLDHRVAENSKGYGLEKWLQEFDDLLKEARERDISVIVFLPNVEFASARSSVPSELCVEEWFRILNDDCRDAVERAYLDRRFPERWYRELRLREQRLKHLHLFDPMPIYCPEADRCSRVVSNTLAFRDTHHLTESGALLMLEPLSRFLWQRGFFLEKVNNQLGADRGTSGQTKQFDPETNVPLSAKTGEITTR